MYIKPSCRMVRKQRLSLTIDTHASFKVPTSPVTDNGEPLEMLAHNGGQLRLPPKFILEWSRNFMKKNGPV